MARAAAEERSQRASGSHLPSPMPGGKYDFWRGETSLIRPAPLPLDAELAELCHRFAAADAPTRASMRSAISMDEFYTLLTFGKRSAVFAIRERSERWIADGLTALALMDRERVDYRDVYMPLSLLHHAAERIEADIEQLFRTAARLSEPRVAAMIDGFLARSPRGKALRESWGFDEVETADGIGFIHWGLQPYEPALDLKHAAIEIADFLAMDKYQPSSVYVATDLPRVWLQTQDNTALDAVLARVRAGASVHARLRPDQHPQAARQSLIVFLVETEDDADARTLRELSSRKRPLEYAMLGVAEGQLFCLVIAKESFETAQTIERFAPGISAILQRHAAR